MENFTSSSGDKSTRSLILSFVQVIVPHLLEPIQHCSLPAMMSMRQMRRQRASSLQPQGSACIAALLKPLHQHCLISTVMSVLLQPLPSQQGSRYVVRLDACLSGLSCLRLCLAALSHSLSLSVCTCDHLLLVQAHPEAVGEAVQRIVTSYEGGSQYARSGAALALRACAPQLNNQQVPIALDFLLGHGLADIDDGVRGQMVSAGASVTNRWSLSFSSSFINHGSDVDDDPCRHVSCHRAWS